MKKRLGFSVLLLMALAVGAVAQSDQLKIVDHPMSEKVSRPRGSRPVEYVMLHFSSDVVAHPEAPYNLDRVIATYGNAASANYLIDREGNVFRLVKEDRVAWHAGKGALPWPPYLTNNLNSYSIGIEMMNVSTWKDMKVFMSKETYDKVAKKDIGYTDAQYKSLNLLLADIRSRWPKVTMDRHHIVAHSTYAPGRRSDPGELFDWTRIGLPLELPKN
jgi:N-acetyl-anhydromuramyl-L-alanine amidase AmpD